MKENCNSPVKLGLMSIKFGVVLDKFAPWSITVSVSNVSTYTILQLLNANPPSTAPSKMVSIKYFVKYNSQRNVFETWETIKEKKNLNI